MHWPLLGQLGSEPTRSDECMRIRGRPAWACGLLHCYRWKSIIIIDRSFGCYMVPFCLDGSCVTVLHSCMTHFHYPNLFFCYSLFSPGWTDQNVRTRRWNEHIQRSQWTPWLGPSERSAQSWSDCFSRHIHSGRTAGARSRQGSGRPTSFFCYYLFKFNTVLLGKNVKPCHFWYWWKNNS